MWMWRSVPWDGRARTTGGRDVIDTSDIGVFLGLDVGKGEHHATAVTPAGKKAFDKRLPNSEPKLREVFAKLQAKHGTVLVVVDQPASIGALPLAVARDMGCQVAYLPGLTMRRIADLYPGEAKTDARDAFVIADAARTMPHTLRSIDLDDETIAELEMIVGFDDDLAGEATRISNRLRGLLTQIHPSLERVLGPRVQHPAVLRLLDQFGSPAQIRKAGRRRLVTLIRPEGTADGRAAGRGHLHRAGRADRHRPRHRRGRTDRPQPRQLAPSASLTSANSWPPGSRNCWRPTLFPRS